MRSWKNHIWVIPRCNFGIIPLGKYIDELLYFAGKTILIPAKMKKVPTAMVNHILVVCLSLKLGVIAV